MRAVIQPQKRAVAARAVAARAVAASCLHEPAGCELPHRLTELGGREVPALFLCQRLYLPEDSFRERARVVQLILIIPMLDVNEDAEDVLPQAPAVFVALDVLDVSMTIPLEAPPLPPPRGRVFPRENRCWSRYDQSER